MLKFFRKYNKAILAVGCSLLMVVFLLPQGLQQLSRSAAGQLVAAYEGGEIHGGALRRAQQELNMLQRIHPAIPQALLQVESPLHWTLLSRRAEASGFVGGPQDGRDFLSTAARQLAYLEAQQRLLNQFGPQLAAQLAPRMAQQRSPQLFNTLEQRRTTVIAEQAVPAQTVDSVLAKARGVLRMYQSYLDVVTLSRPEALRQARRLFDRAEISYALLSSSTMIDQDDPPPDEERIREHFEQYKDVPPGQGDHGFGYRRPDAVQLEWLTIERQPIAETVQVDPIEANTYWRNNKEEFADTFSEARDAVISRLRSQAADRAMREARRAVQAELLKASGDLPTEGPYKELPDDWASRRPSLDSVADAVAEALSRELGVDEAPKPEVVRRDQQWLSRSEVADLPGIGQSARTVGGDRTAFPALAFSVRTLDPDSRTGVQVGLTAGPLRNSAGDVFFFRVLDARASSPPESVDEVREQVAQDLHRLDAFERLKQRASDLRRAVAEQGLQTVAEEHGVEVSTGAQVTRENVTPQDHETVNTEDFRNAVLDRAMSLDPTVPPDQIDALERSLAVPLPPRLSLALVRIDSFQPLSAERFRQRVAGVINSQRAELRRSGHWPFTMNAMADRLNVRYPDENQDQDVTRQG